MDTTEKVVATLDGTLAGREARQALQEHIDAIYEAIHNGVGPQWMYEQFDRITDQLATNGQALCNCGLADPGFHEPLDNPDCINHRG